MVSGKTALVTGAGSGIGRATALRFARDGARLIVADVDPASVLKTCEDIRAAGGEASAIHGDVTDLQHHEAIAALAKERYGSLDIAVNNAGIAHAATPLADLDPEAFIKVMNVNLVGVFLGLKVQLREMAAAGGGAIVNMSSICGAVGRRGSGGYVASKHGVVGLTKTAALEYAEAGVRVNAVGPGFVETPFLAGRDVAPIVGLHPLGRLALPDEIAELILFLSSDRASFATGGYYPVDGGYMAQ